ncbi:MAG: hypothetical protein WCA49_06050 [Candidatus Sulfotelmatobacter sp.]
MANLRSDSEFTGRLGIKLPCDWQILSLLKSANARPGSETEDTINLAAVLSFVLQSLLHLLYVVPIPNRRDFFTKVAAGNERARAWSGDACPQQ